jgi:hypothetical protein
VVPDLSAPELSTVERALVSQLFQGGAEMAQIVQQILAKLKEMLEELDRRESEAAHLALEMGRQLQRLKRKARGRWLEYLKTINFNERLARRYLKVAEEWPTDRAPGSDLLDRMPGDLHKLEWLCRLPLEQLAAACKTHDFRKADRGQVIALVKKLLGKEEPPKQVTPDLIHKKWVNWQDRLLGDLAELGAEERQRAIQDLEGTLEGFRASLHEVDDDLASEEDEETEEPSEAGEETDAEDGTEGPATDEPATDKEDDLEEEEPGVKPEPTRSTPPKPATKPAGRRGKTSDV